MDNFQSYINEDGIVITSKSAEATINGWCQEFTAEETAMLKKLYDEEMNKKSFWNRFKTFFKGGNRKCKK